MREMLENIEILFKIEPLRFLISGFLISAKAVQPKGSSWEKGQTIGKPKTTVGKLGEI